MGFLWTGDRLVRFAVIAIGAVALLIMGAAAPAPSGPDLWNGAAAGMTIDQVAVAVPRAKPATGQLLEDGSQSGLSAPTQLPGGPADAVFFFRGKGLSAVLVERRAMRPGHGSESLAEARRLVAAAAGQYGGPGRCVDRSQIAALACAWTPGAIKVTISYHDFGGGSPALSVLYRPAR